MQNGEQWEGRGGGFPYDSAGAVSGFPDTNWAAWNLAGISGRIFDSNKNVFITKTSLPQIFQAAGFVRPPMDLSIDIIRCGAWLEFQAGGGAAFISADHGDLKAMIGENASAWNSALIQKSRGITEQSSLSKVLFPIKVLENYEILTVDNSWQMALWAAQRLKSEYGLSQELIEKLNDKRKSKAEQKLPEVQEIFTEIAARAAVDRALQRHVCGEKIIAETPLETPPEIMRAIEAARASGLVDRFTHWDDAMDAVEGVLGDLTPEYIREATGHDLPGPEV